MRVADKITSSRLIMAPLFYVLYFLPGRVLIFTILLWLLFIGSAVSDMLDGMVARRRGEVSDFGKLYDPFADTLAQLSFFLCFVIDGIFHPILFLLVLYREFSILFMRNLMLRKGVSQGARMGGKIKTVSYITAVALALLASTCLRLGLFLPYYDFIRVTASVVFMLSVAIAAGSFFDYLILYRKTPGGDDFEGKNLQ